MPEPARRNAPKKLSPRHYTMAALRAAGWKWREIATEMGLSVEAVRAVGMSPFFKVEVQRLTRQNTEAIGTNYVDTVMRDGDANVKFLTDLRSGKLPELSEMPAGEAVRARLDASKTLFERQMPKVRESDSQPAVTVIFQQQEVAVMRESLEHVGKAIPQLDDVIADFKRQEQDEAARTLGR